VIRPSHDQIIAKPMDKAQVFWDSFRKSWRASLPRYKDSFNDPKRWTTDWTELIKQAAEQACHGLAASLNCEVEVGREGYNRTDVHAIDRGSRKLLVAFESELAPWGKKGDWRQEFGKLCEADAVLRVLSGTFTPGTGRTFPVFLREKLDYLRASFDKGHSGGFCLIFGPGPFDQDPEQAWLAYSLERDYSVRELVSASPLIPLRVIRGQEGTEE
jgi:hypothetical protein